VQKDKKKNTTNK